MNIGGIGDISFAGMTAVRGLNSVSGLSNSPGITDAASLSAVSTGRMDQLIQLMSGFSTSEILVAMMLANASGAQHRRAAEVEGSAMSSQLGFALMGQMPGQSADLLGSANSDVFPTQASLIGAQLNVQA